MEKSAVRESTPCAKTSSMSTMQRKSIKKRKATLKKKAEELAILCDAEVCMVISDGQAAAAAATTEVIWPEDPATAKAIMIKYKESSKRKQQVAGVSGLVGSKRKRSVVEQEDEKKEGLGGHFGTMWDEELDKLPVESLMDFSRALESKIESVDKRIRFLEGKATAIQVHYDPLLIPDDFELNAELDAMLKECEENDHHLDPVVFNDNNNLIPWPLGFEEAQCSNYNMNNVWDMSTFEAADDNFGLLGFDANSINNNMNQLIPNWDHQDVQPRMMGFNAADQIQYMAAPEILAQPSPSGPSPSPLLEVLPMAFWPQPSLSHSTAYQSFSHQF